MPWSILTTYIVLSFGWKRVSLEMFRNENVTDIFGLSIAFLRFMEQKLEAAVKFMQNGNIFHRISIQVNLMSSCRIHRAIFPCRAAPLQCKRRILYTLTTPHTQVPEYSILWLSFTIQKPSHLCLCNFVKENFKGLFSLRKLLLLGQTDNNSSLYYKALHAGSVILDHLNNNVWTLWYHLCIPKELKWLLEECFSGSFSLNNSPLKVWGHVNELHMWSLRVTCQLISANI